VKYSVHTVCSNLPEYIILGRNWQTTHFCRVWCLC